MTERRRADPAPPAHPGYAPPLPRELEELVRAVVTATRLPLPEREEVARELRAHFEDGLASGRSVEELELRFGDPERAALSIRTARSTGVGARTRDAKRRWKMSVGDVRRELVRSARALFREPTYAAVVILTLALGIGANTAVFTVLDSVLIEPLPYPDADRLVRIYDVWHEDPGELNDYLRTPAVQAYRTWDAVFDGVATLYTYRETGVDLTDGDRPERVVASQVSAGYFETLGVFPILGRTFNPEESLRAGVQTETRIGAQVAILSYGLWQRAFGGDRSVVGRTVALDGESYQVVGIMPQGLTNPIGSPPDLWLPADLRLGENVRSDWGNHYLTGIARLRDGLTLEGAQERVDALNARLSEAEPDNEGWLVALRPLQAAIVGEERRALIWILAGAVGLVLLSSCVNVANLVFARSLTKDRDLALRGALGSGRTRIVMHLLSETGLLAGAGGVCGLLLGTVGIHGLLALAPDALPLVTRPELNARVFGFALLCTFLALLVFGLVPALRLSRTSPADILRAGGRSGTETRGIKHMRDTLVVAQVAVAVTLVAGAGLLLRSFQELRSVNLGIQDQGVLTFEVHLPESRYPDGAARQQFHETFQERVASVPGVEAVGAVSWLPVNGRYHWWSMATSPGWDGESEAEDATWIDTDVRVFSGDYFASMGIQLLRGTSPSEVDLDGPPVVWINRRAAETVFSDQDPLEEYIYVGDDSRRVVGVVEDTPFDSRGSVSRKVYIPHADFSDDRNWALIQTVKARGDLNAIRDQIMEVLAGQDPELVVYRARPLSDLLVTSRAQERFAALLMTVFAGLSLTLALVGTYGVVAGGVTRRRREMGIRIALGANPANIQGMVLASSIRLSLVGVAVGVTLAWLGSRSLSDLLFQVNPGDPSVYLMGAIMLVAMGAVAAWVPARNATRVDPAEALGAE